MAAGGRVTGRVLSRFTSGAPPVARRVPVVTGRLCSSERATPRSPTQRSASRPAASSTHDWIGPPHPLSNLRPVVHRVPPRETALERRLRRLRQQTEDWNQEFWSQQNITFSQEKESFILCQLKAKGLTVRDEQGRRRSLHSDDMAVFYKRFLDENRTRHANYNREWYRRNFSITLLMARVFLSNVWRTVSDRSSRRQTPPT
ncbi:cytochrome c oxidase assembly factor 8 [Antennarius striatus]|uniref:cytochrome c oxidase assembly factor 8 n=1 Tax=Antennarius striatus TaxID=241820 RepID=UPI0035B30AC8